LILKYPKAHTAIFLIYIWVGGCLGLGPRRDYNS
jgi:hypothetical protein